MRTSANVVAGVRCHMRNGTAFKHFNHYYTCICSNGSATLGIIHMLRGTAKVEELLPDVWKQHHPEAIRTYRTEERQEKASMALEQAAKRRVRSELRKSL